MAKNRVEFCRETDLAELFVLFAQWYKFNPRMRERDFFDWQFRDAPTRLSKAAYDFLVLRNEAGRMTGCLGAVGFQMRTGSSLATAAWSHNWFAEGQGDGGLALLGRMTELAGNRFFLRLNQSSSTIIKLLRVPIMETMPRWWVVLNQERAEELFSIDDDKDRTLIRRSGKHFQRLDAVPIARRVERFDPQEEFFFSHFPGILGHARRDGRYLNWRYLDIPRHNYRIIRTERGLGVFRIENIMGTASSVVRILEWTFPAEETRGALASVMQEATAFDPIIIDFHCTSRNIGAVLGPYGFIPQTATTVPMPDLFRPTYRSGGYAVAIDMPPHRTTRAIDFDTWYITAGDSDIDRVKL